MMEHLPLKRIAPAAAIAEEFIRILADMPIDFSFTLEGVLAMARLGSLHKRNASKALAMLKRDGLIKNNGRIWEISGR